MLHLHLMSLAAVLLPAMKLYFACVRIGVGRLGTCHFIAVLGVFAQADCGTDLLCHVGAAV